MFPTPFVVVLDANVLYPSVLRDTLLRAARMGSYQPRWSSKILDELTRNLVKNGAADDAHANKLRSTIEAAFPDAMVSGFEFLIDAMPNQEKDRHVAAVAVRASAQVIVTANLKDFKTLPEGLEAQSPDAFLSDIFDLDPPAMIELLEKQAADKTKPPMTAREIIARLEKTNCPDFAALVIQQLDR